MSPVVVSLVCGAAVLAWPGQRQVAPTRRRSAWGGARPVRSFDPVAETLEVLDSLVALLRAGAAAAPALRMAIGDLVNEDHLSYEGWRGLQAIAEADGDLADGWAHLADEWQAPTLLQVSTAWRLSTRQGCPLADALAAAADGIRASRSHAASVSTAVAGANATIGVLVLLPVLGVLLGRALGVDLIQTYQGPRGLITLWPGLALMWVGRTWAARMVRKALVQQEVS